MSVELYFNGSLSTAVGEREIAEATHDVLESQGYAFVVDHETAEVVSEIESPYGLVQRGGSIWGVKELDDCRVDFPYHGVSTVQPGDTEYRYYSVALPRSSSRVYSNEYVTALSEVTKGLLSLLDFEILHVTFDFESAPIPGYNPEEDPMLGSVSYYADRHISAEDRESILTSSAVEAFSMDDGVFVRTVEKVNDTDRRSVEDETGLEVRQ